MNDQIKLAKAMGLGLVAPPYQRHDEDFVRIPLANGTDKKFDPYTDANDDYAVLEWMRSNKRPSDWWNKFHDALSDFPEIGYKGTYKIGDYARAALKVIE